MHAIQSQSRGKEQALGDRPDRRLAPVDRCVPVDAMSNHRQQSLKEVLGAKKTPTVENDSDPEPRLSDSDSDILIADCSLGGRAPESEAADSQPSGASYAASTTIQAGDEEMEFELLDKPYQPRTGVFPKRQFGQKNPEYRAFKPNWFDNKLWCSWLHWESKNNRAYCFICRNVCFASTDLV